MSNTVTRIISGLILLIMVVASVMLGDKSSLILIGLIGLFVIDELITNFYDQKRSMESKARKCLVGVLQISCGQTMNDVVSS